MKQHKSYLCHALLAIAAVTGLHSHALAQATRPASNSTAPTTLQLCNAITCPTAGQTTRTTSIATLNTDVVTIEDNGATSACYPATFGINSTWSNLWGIAFSNVNNANLTNASGFTIGNSVTPGIYASLPIPYWFGVGATMNAFPANDPDIAVGTCYSSNAADYKHFALVVYEYNGEIFMDHYEIVATSTGITTMPPEPFTCPFPPPIACAIPGNHTPVLLSSNTNFTASKPHIELWHEIGMPSNGQPTIATRYAVTWQQEDPGNPGQMQVWGVDGEIDDPGTTLFPAPNQDFVIDEGIQPDVVAINFFDAAGAVLTSPQVAYAAYLTDDGKNVMLTNWAYNTQTVGIPQQLNTNSTANNDEFKVPRISGPMYADSYTPSLLDPYCVVVVNDNDANYSPTIDKVTAYKVYDPSITGPGPIIEKVDISDYNNTDGFASYGNIAIMPVVTGIGEVVESLAGASVAAYRDYPVVFYSDYVTNSSADGDFYAFGLNMDVNVSDPNLYFPSTPDEYWEVNYNTLDNGSNFDLAGDRPAVAAATANNSGYDLLTTYFDGAGTSTGEQVTWAFAGTTNTYSFKQGKTTGLQETKVNGIAVYPNPVRNQLNIVQASGANYILMDITGKSLTVGNITGNKASVDVSSLASGMYMLQLTKDGHTEKVKFVKQ